MDSNFIKEIKITLHTVHGDDVVTSFPSESFDLARNLITSYMDSGYKFAVERV
jgi:hypothetical protein